MRLTVRSCLALRKYCTIPQTPASAAMSKPPLTSQPKDVNVPGLSNACLALNEPVGPGASKTGDYKVPEYFNYNKMSYFEAEIEMAKYRCPQPSAVKK